MKKNEYTIKICIMFLIAILIYGYYVSTLTIPVHILGDEELNVSMAKSFYYNHTFEQYYQLLNYKCVLYPMLLSTAYFFYSPDTIMFTMRMIGVVCSVSSIFPLYLLARKVLSNNRKAFIISSLGLFIPEIMNCGYLMQEVLAYPLFLWAIYFIYLDFAELSLASPTNKDFSQHNISSFVSWKNILASLFLILAFFTKTYMFIFPIIYVSVLFIAGAKTHDMKLIKKALLNAIICLVLVALGLFLIYFFNDFQTGINHYDSQIMNLFPITIEFPWQVLKGILFYFAFYLLTIGIFPFVFPISNIRQYKQQDHFFLLLITLYIIGIIIETVICILCTEETGFIYPHKFYFRYLFICSVPFFIMSLKLEPSICKVNKWCIMSGFFSILIAYIYYQGIGTDSYNAIMDGNLFLTVQNINKFIIPNFGMFFVFSYALLLFFIFLYCIRKNHNLRTLYCKIALPYLVCFFILNALQLPYYSNQTARGLELQPEFIKISHTINRESYDKVYYVAKSQGYTSCFYGYMNCDYKFINMETSSREQIASSGEKIAFIIASDDNYHILGANKIDTDLTLYSLYENDSSFDKIIITN